MKKRKIIVISILAIVLLSAMVFLLLLNSKLKEQNITIDNQEVEQQENIEPSNIEANENILENDDTLEEIDMDKVEIINQELLIQQNEIDDLIDVVNKYAKTKIYSIEILESTEENAVVLATYEKSTEKLIVNYDGRFISAQSYQYCMMSGDSSPAPVLESNEEKITALKTYDWFIDIMNYVEIPENVNSLEIYCDVTDITPYLVIKNENEVIIHRANYDAGKFKLNSKNISSDKMIEEVMSYKLLMTFDKNTDEVKFLNLQTLELPEVKYLGENL